MEIYENTLYVDDKHGRPINNKNNKNNKYNLEKHIKSKYNVSMSPEITYENYISNKINLIKCKMPELKAAVKRYKLLRTGNKGLLIERLTNYYNQTKNVIKIQSIYRMWLVLHMTRLRGPGLTDRSNCVNQTDFSTLESINDISRDNFFSYKDTKGFLYGFDIISLAELMHQNVSFQNPYNRETFTSNIKNDIITLYKLNCMLVPNFKEDNIKYNKMVYRNANVVRSGRQITRAYNPRINPMQNVEMFAQYENITHIRNRPISTRVSEVFIAMDRLGNYTSSEWFNRLDLRGYIRLYRHLYDIWYVRSGLSYETRSLICPYGCPFDGIFRHRMLYSELTHDQIKTACVIVFENLVYSGITDEYKTLGAFYSLSALTIVSNEARLAMPWLYEAVM